MDYYGSIERLKEISFDDKRRLLHWLFDGKDRDGMHYGIYIKKASKDAWEYFIYGEIVSGVRVLKGKNINYFGSDIDEGDITEHIREAGPCLVRKKPIRNVQDEDFLKFWKNPEYKRKNNSAKFYNTNNVSPISMKP